MNSELRIKAERAVRDAETFDIQISTGLISPVPTDAEFWKGNQVEMESSRKHNEWLDTGVWTKHTAIITALPMAHRITLQSPAYDASVSDGSDELKQLMESLGEVLVFRHMEKAMTITFTSDEWERHVAAIDEWRFQREKLLLEVLSERMSEPYADTLLLEWRQRIKDSLPNELSSPIGGTKLRISSE